MAFNGKDGLQPYGGLIIDGSGNLYGTTTFGGAYNGGSVFEVTPKAGGGWIEKLLRSFNGIDGKQPYGTLILDGSGNLYGTTSFGGAYTWGIVFDLTAQNWRGWTEKVLHSFDPYR
jgi:uncharacterized repeat protein (TIGR03803 family)